MLSKHIEIFGEQNNDGIHFAYGLAIPFRNSFVADNDEKAVAAVAAEIKRYLEAHPNAADSVEGITRWWLARQRFEEATQTVQRALDHLVTEGEVVKSVTGEGRLLYSRTK